MNWTGSASANARRCRPPRSARRDGGIGGTAGTRRDQNRTWPSRSAAGTRFADLPPALVGKAKIHILDTIGAALAGTRSAEFRMVRSLLHAVPPREDGAITGARVWGTPLLVSARDAALANGVAAQAFELDDTGGCDHSGAVVVPAVLAALAQAPQPVSGKALIASVVVGYDVGRRVLEAAGGYDAHNGAGWHSTGTCGPIGAAAAIANLWGLSPQRCRSAIALATSTSAGLWAFIHDGSQAKKIHAGRAAEGGLLAAALAAQGLSGPTRVFDDVWGGFFTSFNHQPGRGADRRVGHGVEAGPGVAEALRVLPRHPFGGGLRRGHPGGNRPRRRQRRGRRGAAQPDADGEAGTGRSRSR
ncbi:MmgE/PrpD family protein [Azospirillum sp. TSO35-2]|uniref:MmgE/PrpD family protein n=1 Tax=Azospirillum sp. TSO35-2 TaxID=716796 RepID=UPI0018EEB5B3|nr:MmgE/PrpD family protein [Azospirillum sp. TSO35-2]